MGYFSTISNEFSLYEHTSSSNNSAWAAILNFIDETVIDMDAQFMKSLDKNLIWEGIRHCKLL